MNSSYEDIPFDYHIAREHSYYDIFNIQYDAASHPELNNTSDTNTILRGVFAFISRIGFILIQVGSIPVENVYLILFYNIIEIAFVIASYGLIGYMLSFGNSSIAGWIGFSKLSTSFADIDQAVVGFSACLLGTAQISTFLVGRIHMVGGLLITFLYCSLFQPLLIHWIWYTGGWMAKSKFLQKRVAIKDHGGDLVLHVSSSVIGLTGAAFLGRRVMKLKDLDEFSLGNEMVVGTLTGYVLIILGYIVFSLPTPLYESLRSPNNYPGIILVNSIIAVTSGLAMVSFLHFTVYQEIFKYWIILRCIQGGMAGFISVAAGIDVYTPLVASGVAAIGAIFFFFFAILIHNTALEDCCNITSSHLVCGFLGTLACPLLAEKENLGNAVNVQSRGVHLLWQFICLMFVIIITIIFSLLIFIILHYAHILRNRYESLDHRMAIILEHNLPRRSYLERLFMIDDKTDHIVPGKYREKFIQPEINMTDRSANANKTLTFSDDVKGKALPKKMQTKLEREISINYQVEAGDSTILNVAPNINNPKTIWPLFGSGDYYDPYNISIKTNEDNENFTDFTEY